jgi:lipoate---protein ligase
MFALCSTVHDPFFNLAAEDFLLHNSNNDYLILYINDPSVIIGKHQIICKEVNTFFTEKENIPVIRRISGGGTVYHDRGNLNYSFIRKSQQGKQVDFRLYTQPVIGFLNSLGISAILGTKHELQVDGLKISGNSEHVFRDRVLHHGTLLFDASLDNMRMSIKPESANYKSHAVNSNRTTVTNLKALLPEFHDIQLFKESFISYLNSAIPDLEEYALTTDEVNSIKDLAESKYMTWKWNYAYGPQYSFVNRINTDAGVIKLELVVSEGIISEINIEGDDELKFAVNNLIGCRHIFNDLMMKVVSDNLKIPDELLHGFF